MSKKHRAIQQAAAVSQHENKSPEPPPTPPALDPNQGSQSKQFLTPGRMLLLWVAVPIGIVILSIATRNGCS